MHVKVQAICKSHLPIRQKALTIWADWRAHAGKGVAISTPEPERADSAELVDAIPAQTAWETRIATLTENLKDALCEVARLRSQKSVCKCRPCGGVDH